MSEPNKINIDHKIITDSKMATSFWIWKVNMAGNKYAMHCSAVLILILGMSSIPKIREFARNIYDKISTNGIFTIP